MKIDVKLPDIASMLSDAKRARVMKQASFGAQQAIHSWYASLPADYFDSTESNFPDGTPKHGGARTFMRALTRGWSPEDVSESGFTLAFRANRDNGSPWGLRLQEMGGTITPSNAAALTIPLTAEARGRRARDFSASVHELFTVGKARATGDKLGTLAWRDDAGQLHAAYALRKSATIKPLFARRGHHAVPTEKQLSDMVSPYFRAAVFNALNSLD